MSGLSKKQIAMIRSLYTRHGRKKSNLCICEGERCCSELFTSRPDLVRLAVCTEGFEHHYPRVEFITVSDKELQSLSATVASQGVLAVAERPAPPPHNITPGDPFILVLDRIADPGNFGTILRTAQAVGLKEIWYTVGSADPFGEKTIRAALAAQFKLQMRCLPDLSTLAGKLYEFGYDKVYRTDPHQGESCFKAPGLFDKSALIIGNEANGAAAMAGAVDVTIPMPGAAESLNAAQAATIFLFEYVRRQNL
jgi:RNA methyltransferase, TrmH family